MTLSAGISNPLGIAFDSAGNLYVANSGTGNVEEFSPAITPMASSVTIESSIESRPMDFGNGSVSGIDLTNAELVQIFTTSTGTLTLGDPLQTGNITFNSATPATTSGASLAVVQSANGAGAIVLAGSGVANANGSLSLTSGTGGVQVTIPTATTTSIEGDGVTLAGGPLSVTTAFAPNGKQLTVIANLAAPAGTNLISGTFSNLAQGATGQASFSSATYPFHANYQAGDGNDLVLTFVGPPSDLLVSASPTGLTAGSTTSLTITAEDAYGDVVTTFSDTVTLTDSLGGASFGAVTFSNGLATVTATLDAAGAQTITASDSTATISGTSNSISVTPAAASKLLVSASPCEPFSRGARPASRSRPKTSSTTSSPVSAIPSRFPIVWAAQASRPYRSAGGKATALGHAGHGRHANHHGQRFDRHDLRHQQLSYRYTGRGQQAIGLGCACKSLRPGSTTSVTITAEDRFNNVVTGFSDSVTLSDSLGGASFSAVSFTGGRATVAATLDTAGTQTITARIRPPRSPAPATRLPLHRPRPASYWSRLSPTISTAGSTTSVSITAEDQFNNIVTGFSDSVTLSDNLGGASFSTVSFTGGRATVTATLDTAGTQTITATDSTGHDLRHQQRGHGHGSRSQQAGGLGVAHKSHGREHDQRQRHGRGSVQQRRHRLQ